MTASGAVGYLLCCPRCGGNLWYDRDRDESRCDTCEWPDPDEEKLDEEAAGQGESRPC